MALTHKRHREVNGQQVHLSGWKPDRPDHRDQRYAIPLMSPIERVQMQRNLPSSQLGIRIPWLENLGIYNQLNIGSCTANGVLAALRWLYVMAGFTKSSGNVPEFSRLYQYAKARQNEGTPLSEDGGCTIRGAISTLHTNGACPEKLWPYLTNRFDEAPPMTCDIEAEKHQSMAYHRVPNDVLSIRRELAAGYPVVFGFTVYESFMSDKVAKTGVVPIPQNNEKTAGGHCMNIIGSCMERQAFLCSNWWGAEWGDEGLCWMPHWFWEEKVASDPWVIRTAELVPEPKPIFLMNN